MDEFDLIRELLAPLAGPEGLGLRDDAALFTPPPGRELVLSADMMAGGIHFLPGDPPRTIARKLLRTNLSDLAATGATPHGYLLTVSAGAEDIHAWLGDFCHGLALDQREFGLALWGGDMSGSTGGIHLSMTVIGSVVPGRALRRQRGRPGDLVCVSGTIGDAGLGLRLHSGERVFPGLSPGEREWLVQRLVLPCPRLSAGAALAAMPHAGRTGCVDISDGLLQDLAHLLPPGCGACIDLSRLPLSGAAAALLASGETDYGALLSGGEDYELCIIWPEEAEPPPGAVGACPLAVIGRVTAGGGIRLCDDHGRPVPLPPAGGYGHFRSRDGG